MTDLFSRIAERALGLAPTIQPMATPFYAATQPQESSDLPFETFDEVERGERRQAVNTMKQAADEPERPREPVRLPEPARPLRSNYASAPEPPAPASASPARLQHVRDLEQPSYPEHMQYEHIPAQPVSVYSPITERLPRSAPGYPPPGYPQGVPLRYTARLAGGESGAAHPGNEKASLAGTLGLRTDSIPEPAGDRERARIVGVPLAGTLEADSHPRAVPEQTRRHPNEAVQEVIQAAPTVHVTIGRIEVRATPAPATQAQAARQQAAPKAMSLDEYLKQSGKGGRG